MTQVMYPICTTCGGVGKTISNLHINSQRDKDCPSCKGTGFFSIPINMMCTVCNGTGKIVANNNVSSQRDGNCPSCKGTGVI